MKPGKHQRANKDAKIYVAHTLCISMSYVTKTFLLVSSSVESNNNTNCILCTVKTKKENKNGICWVS